MHLNTRCPCFYIRIVLLLMLIGLLAVQVFGAEESLQEQLDARKATFRARTPQDLAEMMAEGNRKVAESGVLESAKQVGDDAPDFTLEDATGQPVSLASLLEKGPVVLLWYRGGWCPYCNLTLHAYQEHLDEIKSAGATLVALTPEVPDQSLSTAEKNELEFVVLSDTGNKVAREYGVVFELPPEIHELYQSRFDLHAYNGDDSGTLPLSATYVIAPNGKITYAFLDADYTNRADPVEVIEEVKAIQTE